MPGAIPAIKEALGDDVATAIDSVENDKQASWTYDRDNAVRAIQLAVFKQPGSNTVEVANQVRKLIPVFNAQLPPSVRLVVRGDRSISIRRAFEDIQFTMVLTMVLVVAVIFVFLRSPGATLIPALALPFSILRSSVDLSAAGFSALKLTAIRELAMGSNSKLNLQFGSRN